MALVEYDRVRLVRTLTADDGRELPAGTTGTIVHVWHDGSGPAAYEVEVNIRDASEDIGSWHLATAAPDDLEAIGTLDGDAG